MENPYLKTIVENNDRKPSSTHAGVGCSLLLATYEFRVFVPIGPGDGDPLEAFVLGTGLGNVNSHAPQASHGRRCHQVFTSIGTCSKIHMFKAVIEHAPMEVGTP